MTAWWAGLSRRERALLGVLAFLFLALAAWYGIWRPVTQFHRAAALRHEQAVREQQTVQSLLARIEAAPAPEQQARRPLAEAVRQSLEQAGITAARLEADPDGALRVAVSAVPSALLLPWIAALQTAHGVTPRHLVVVKEGQGLLGLDATFVRDGG